MTSPTSSAPPPSALRSLAQRAWTMWVAVWAASVLSSLAAVVTLTELSGETFEASLEASLTARVQDQARMAAVALKGVPVEAVAALGGVRSARQLTEDLSALAASADLHDLALIGPADRVIAARGGTVWVVAEADASLIEKARAGSPEVGPLYQGADDTYLAAYAPLATHPGWVVAAEGSGEPLQAAARMKRTMVAVSAMVLGLATVLGGGLAIAVTWPLGQLSRSLRQAHPGSTASAVPLSGPREVRLVAHAARRLLNAVAQRDQELREAHDRELRQITAMSAAVAHEVRNPLNALGLALGRLEHVRAEGKDAATLQVRIRASLDEIDGIVQRFLDVSRPPSPRLESVSLASVLDELADDAAASGVKLVLPDQSVQLVVDPSLLRQALRNLVINAAQAGASQVALRVAGSRPLVLQVEDDGPGIDPSQCSRLFDWFHTSRAEGSGLGLPSARRALRAMGGELDLLSAQPAVFQITLGEQPR